MEDVAQATAALLCNQFPNLQQMTPCERFARFKLVLEAALLAYAESRRAEFSDN